MVACNNGGYVSFAIEEKKTVTESNRFIHNGSGYEPFFVDELAALMLQNQKDALAEDVPKKMQCIQRIER